MEVNEVAMAWEQAAKSDKAQGYIHPAGNLGTDAYEQSGQESAAALMSAISPYLGILPTNPKVLDFGCGDGRVLKYVAREFADIWGADASATMLERLARRVPEAKRIQSTATDGVMDGMGFNLIYSLAVFIHHDHSGGRDMLVGLANAAAPGAILAIQIPCYEVARERDGWIDVTVWTETLIYAAVKRAGLAVVELHKCPGEFSYENVGENHFKVQVFRKQS